MDSSYLAPDWTVLQIPKNILFPLGAVALFIFTLRAIISIFRSPESIGKTPLSSVNQ